MSGISSYGKIESLTSRNSGNIFDTDVIVQEKIDGSQISFGIINDELMIRSKNKEIDKNKAGMFLKGVSYLFSIKGLLEKNIIYRGEYLQKEKHNCLTYDRTPANNIMLFEIEDLKRNSLSKEEKLRLAKKVNLEFVPTLFEGRIDQDEVSKLLKLPSTLGGSIEGIVIKNYNLIDRNGRYICIKYVNDQFKERNSLKKVKKDIPDIVEKIVKSLITEARYLKAVAHLKESGGLEFSNKDIGALLKEIHEDIEDEDQYFIKDLLYNYYIKGIKKDVTAGFAQWYKAYLRDLEL